MSKSINRTDPRRLSKKRIATYAEELFHHYVQAHADTPPSLFSISFDHVYDTVLYPDYGIHLEENEDLGFENGEKVLGCFDAVSNTILLDRILTEQEKARRAFTAWHEVGHAILHRSWIMGQRASFMEGKTKTSAAALTEGNTNLLEWQANFFAASAAAPMRFLDYVLESTFQLTRPIRYVGPTKYDLYVNGCRKLCPVQSYIELCRVISYQIRHRFGGLSIESLSYRVAQSSRVIDVSGEEDGCPSIRLQRTVASTPLVALAQ